MSKNHNPATKLADDELVYRTIEQITIIAEKSKQLTELYVENAGNGKGFNDEETKKVSSLIGEIYHGTRGMQTAPILSRLVVMIASAARSKFLVGAQLVIKKGNSNVTIKAFYGPRPDDYTELELTKEIVEQLRDGLTQALDKIAPKKKFIMPNHTILQ